MADLVRCARRWTPLCQRLDERIFGELAVPVIFVWRADTAHPSCHSIAVAHAALRLPRPIADILSADLAVLPDPQRGSSCHDLYLTTSVSRSFSHAMTSLSL